jgi:Leucine-rich repeat (LRR) protein
MGVLEAISRSPDPPAAREAIKALQDLLASKQPLVRTAAAAALEQRLERKRIAALAEFRTSGSQMSLGPAGEVVRLTIRRPPDRETALRRLSYLECFPALRRLALDLESSEGLSNLETLSELEELSLEITDLAPEHLAVLEKLPRLKKLKFSGDRDFTAPALDQLPALATLESLEVRFSSITDRGLAPLVRLPSLRSLDIVGSPITNDGIAALAECKALESLTICAARFDDGAFAHVARIDGLKSLTLSANHRITGSDVAQLAALADSLRAIDLSHTLLTDAALEHLTALRKLEVLKLNQTHITNSGLKHLASLTGLVELHLSNTAITDEGAAHLAPLTKLAVVNLGYTGITDKSLPYFGERKRLALHVPGTYVTNDGLEQLGKTVPLLYSMPERKSVVTARSKPAPSKPAEDPFAPPPKRP